MATFLIRCAESGREQQARLGKLRRDLAAVIGERLPDALIEASPGRVIVETAIADACDVLASLPGVATVSPCVRVPVGDVERAVVALAIASLHGGRTFAIRIRRSGERHGASAAESRPELARRLADAVTLAVPARVDLTSPDIEIGIELRGDDAFVFDRVVHGIDRTGHAATHWTGEPKFVADQMLGRLAVRLRLLGYDTLTVFDIADSEVTRLAAADGRILLTRDGPLARTRAVTVHRVNATIAREQLTEVLEAFGLVPDPLRFFTRCTLCNTGVEAVAESAVSARLPTGVRGRGLAIFRCPHCNQLYWRGAHVDRILAELRM